MTRHQEQQAAGILTLLDALRTDLDALQSGRAREATAAFRKLDRVRDAVSFLIQVSENAFDQFEDRVRELSLLHCAGELFASCFDLDRLCESLLAIVARELQASWTAVYLVEPGNSTPSLRVEEPERLDPPRKALGREAAEWTVREREELLLGDTRHHSRWSQFAEEGAPRSLVCLPLLGRNDCLGAIQLADQEPGAFSVDHLRALRPVATLASVAVRHAFLYRSLADRHQQLEDQVRRRTRDLDTARLALSRHEKMAALGKLAASIAHEINNPMSYVLSNLRAAEEYLSEITSMIRPFFELLSEVQTLPSTTDQAVEKLRARSDQLVVKSHPSTIAQKLKDLRDLMDDVTEGLERIRCVAYELKGFGRSDMEAETLVDLNQIVETALQIAQAEAKNRIRIECRFKATAPIRCHRYQIVQIVLNLLINAIEAIEDSGSVRITTSTQSGWARVEVADDGTGIPEDMYERVFEPFFTTKVGGSSGLGLAISRDIAEAHGGSLRAESDGDGAIFTLTLPSQADPRGRRDPASAGEDSRARG